MLYSIKNLGRKTYIMETKENLLKICHLLFSITDFDIILFDQNWISLCYLTHRTYPDSIWQFFTGLESKLLSHPENQAKTTCFWISVSELEFRYLVIRIQISDTEHYYAISGPVLMISYSDALVKTILQKAKIPLSQREYFYTLYRSLPTFQTKTKNLFLTCYHLLTAADLTTLPPLLLEENTNMDMLNSAGAPGNFSYTKADVQWNCEKERLWRLAVSKGDFKNAKKALSEMTSTDYLYCTPDDSLQTRKHILFSINTLCRAAAIDGGADSVSVQQKQNSFFLLIKNLSNSTELEHLAYRILESYCSLVTQSQYKNFSPLVKKAVTYIHTHYDQPVTLHMTAEAISCGESHLSRCFHNETGKTFKAYVNEYRIQQAISLLETGFYHITDIAITVGFSSYTKFSIAFKQVTGMCASDYLTQKSVI